MSERSLGRSSLVMAGGSIGSRVLGVVRAALLTSIIGAYAAGDAFTLANTLPNVFYMLAAGGLINAVLIPALARAMKLEDGGRDFTDRVVTLAIIGMAIITAVLTACSSLFVNLLAGNRHGDFKSLAIAFSLICMPQIFFYGLFALFGQILNAKHRFGAYAWAPFVANVVAVLGLLLFMVMYPAPRLLNSRGEPVPRSPEMWDGGMIWLFAGSATISVVAQALVLIPALRKSGFRYTPRFGWRGVGLRSASTLAMYAFVGLVISQLGFFINSFVLNRAVGRAPSSELAGPAVHSYAFTIFMLPHAFIAVSIITALYPRLAHAAANRDADQLRSDFRRGIMLPLVANIPVMAFVMVAAEPIVSLLYPGLSASSIQLIAMVLTVMILGIVPFGIDLACYRTLYALEQPKPTLVMQVALTGITLVAGLLTLALAPQWALPIVALAQTVANIVSATIGFRAVDKRIGPIGGGAMIDGIARIGIAAAVAAVLAWGTLGVVSPIFVSDDLHASTLSKVFSSSLVLGLSGLVFVVIYLGVAHALHVREVRDMADLLRRKTRAFR